MDDYRYQQRRAKRGLQCLIESKGLCGCGHRTPPGKKHKKRIVRRALKRQVEQVNYGTFHS